MSVRHLHREPRILIEKSQIPEHLCVEGEKKKIRNKNIEALNWAIACVPSTCVSAHRHPLSYEPVWSNVSSPQDWGTDRRTYEDWTPSADCIRAESWCSSRSSRGRLSCTWNTSPDLSSGCIFEPRQKKQIVRTFSVA